MIWRIPEMKKLLSVLAAAVLVMSLFLSAAAADGPTYWDAASQSYLYNTVRYGIVICRQMKIRDQAGTRGHEYGTIKNGQPVKILGTSQDGNYYMIDLASCGFQGYGPGEYGFGKASLIKADPEFIATTKLTNLYATPWTTELKNGEQTGRFFLVIDQSNGWYAVQANESAVGTAFILSRDVGNYSNGREKYVVTWNCPLLDEDTQNEIMTLKRFTVCDVGYYKEDSEYTLVIINEGRQDEARGWVQSQYIARIIN